MSFRSLRVRIGGVMGISLLVGASLALPAAASPPPLEVTVMAGDVEFLGSGTTGTDPAAWTSVTVVAVDASTGAVAASVTATTDDTGLGGRVSLDLSPGSYRISASADGWLTGWYTGPGDPSASTEEALLSLFGWQPPSSFSLATPISVTGEGPAIPQAFLMLFRNTSTVGGIVGDWEDGWTPGSQWEGRTLFAELTDPSSGEPVAVTTATAAGLYSFSDVAPGEYGLRATIGTAPDGTTPTSPDDLTHADVWWYPGTQDAAAAQTLTVAPGGGHWVAASIATDTAYMESGADVVISGDAYEGGMVAASVAGDGLGIVGGEVQPIESVAWFLDGTPVDGQSATTLVLPAGSAGRQLTATVNSRLSPAAIRFSYSTAGGTAIAAATGAVFTAPVPTIAGTAVLGKTLTAQPGAWAPAGAKTYQWTRDGVAVEGATARQYVIGEADLGRRLAVTVTGTKNGYQTAHRTSADTLVQTAEFTHAPTPTIRGAARVGETLTVGGGTWRPQPVDVAYQWSRGGVTIEDANADSYTLTPDDLGAQLTVSATGSRLGYRTSTTISAPTAAVAPGRITAPRPSLIGQAQVGQTLSIDTSAWTPVDVAVAYRWQRAGVDIPGATAATYTLTAADAGKKVRLIVTVTKDGYETVERTTAATANISP